LNLFSSYFVLQLLCVKVAEEEVEEEVQASFEPGAAVFCMVKRTPLNGDLFCTAELAQVKVGDDGELMGTFREEVSLPFSPATTPLYPPIKRGTYLV
jgi:hypothetical protein